jgi:hypothetical protein
MDKNTLYITVVSQAVIVIALIYFNVKERKRARKLEQEIEDKILRHNLPRGSIDKFREMKLTIERPWLSYRIAAFFKRLWGKQIRVPK